MTPRPSDPAADAVIVASEGMGADAGVETSIGGPSGVRLAASGLTYRVGGAVLVTDLDLDARSGEVLAIVGPNGAGKSTLLGMLAGDLTPSEGEVRLAERPLRSHSTGELALMRAVLPQRSELQFGFTVAEVVGFGRFPHHRRRSRASVDPADPAAIDDELVVVECLRRTEIGDLADRSYPTLSGGERARTDLARVLAQQTPVLLLDEPTAALDLRHQHGVLRIARSLADEGRTVVAVLHELNLASAYADRIAVMAAGRLVELGPPSAVLTPPVIETVFGHPVQVLPHPATGHPVIIG